MHTSIDTYPGAGIFVICPDCENYHVAPERPGFDATVQDACVGITKTTQANYDAFGILEPGGRWDMNQDEGLFVFTQANGRRSGARFSLVGSWVAHSCSWMWAWGLPESHITPATRRASDLARTLGAENDWPVLTSRLLLLNDHEAWHLTKLAASLAGHKVVYRAPVNDKATAYFAIDALKWLD
jgi:hypothetical protein